MSAVFAENPKAASQFKSVNGDLDVIFQPKLSADLLMKTFNGGLFTDFDVMPLPTPAAAVERRNGMSVYRGSRFTGVSGRPRRPGGHARRIQRKHQGSR